jgi:hypothetical protein
LAGLPRPPSFQLNVQCEGQKRPNRNDNGQDADTAERWGDCHRANDVSGDQELETKQDRFANLLAIHPVSQRPLARASFGEREHTGRDKQADHYDQNAGTVDDFRDDIDRGLEVGVSHGPEARPRVGW